MICSRCGAMNDDDNTFCNECGIVLRSSAEKHEKATESKSVASTNFNSDEEKSDPIKHNYLDGENLEYDNKNLQEQWKELEQQEDNTVIEREGGNLISPREYSDNEDEYIMGDNNQDDDDMMDFSAELSDDEIMHGEFSKKESEYHTLDDNVVFDGASGDIQYATGSTKKIIKWVIPTLILLSAVAFLIFLFWPNITKTTMTPQDYYAVAEAKNIRKSKGGFDKLIKKINGASYSVKSEAKAVSSIRGDITDDNLEILKKIKYNFNQISDRENGKYKTEFGIIAGEQNAFNMLILEKDDKAVYSFPEITDGEIVTVSRRWIINILSEDDETLKAMTGLNKSGRDKLMRELVKKVVLDSFSEDNIIESEEEINSQQCDVTSFTINKQIRAKMLLALATEIESNQQLREVIISISRFYNQKTATFNDIYKLGTNVLTEEEIQAIPNNAIEQLKQYADNSTDDTVYKYSVFYAKSMGKPIVSRKIETLDGFHLTQSSYIEGEEIVNELTCMDFRNGINVVIKNKFKERGASIVGKLTVGSVVEKSVTPLTVEYMFEKNAVVAGAPVFIGEINAAFDFNPLGGTEESDIVRVSIASAKKEGTETTVKTLVDIARTTRGVDVFGDNFEIISVYSQDYNIEDFEIPEQSSMDQDDVMKAAQIVADRLMKGVGINPNGSLINENAVGGNNQPSEIGEDLSVLEFI